MYLYIVLSILNLVLKEENFNKIVVNVVVKFADV
jgi:hypothetical protein